MAESAVDRIVFLPALGIGHSSNEAPPILRLGYRFVLSRVCADEAEGEMLLRDSDLDWTLVHPVLLTNGPLSGTYRAAEHLELSSMPLTGTDRLSYPAHNVCAMTHQEIPEPLRTLPADLPAGRLMYPFTDGRSAGASQVPVMWLSDRPLDDADVWWRSLYRDRSATGLYPLLYQYPDDHLCPGDVRDGSSTDAESWFLEMWEAYQRQKAEWAADEPPPALSCTDLRGVLEAWVTIPGVRRTTSNASTP